MRIGVDMSITRINQAGSAVYARSLADALSSIPSGDQYLQFSVDQNRNMASQKTWCSRLNTIYRDLIWTHAVLPSKVHLANIDILHMPTNVMPIVSPCPTVVTILDTTIFQNPQNFTAWHRYTSRIFVPWSAKRASLILTISEQSKRDIVRQFRIHPDKVIVTYLAASPLCQPVPEHDITAIKQRYALRDFILTVGTLEPRKNINRLLRAYAELRRRGVKHQLVHVGPSGWLSDDILSEVERLGLKEAVRFLGRVSLDELVQLYNAASVFAYPSLYEGFGLPPLEAMSCGCPVVTSNVSSLPEVVGDAAVLVDPCSVEQLTDGLQDILMNPALADRLRQRGLERARTFSWERCAHQTRSAYHQAYARTSRVEKRIGT